MKTWEPTLRGDGWGWFAHLSYPWVAHGSGACYVENIETGEAFRVHPEMRCQAGGFPAPAVLLYMTGEEHATVYLLDLTTRVETVICENVDISRAPSAGSGHWAGAYAATGTVLYDSRTIDHAVGWYQACDGPWLAVRGNDGLHLYKDGYFQRTIPFAATCEAPTCRNGFAGYGYNGAARLVECVTGTDRDVSVTMPPKESYPMACGEWVVTATERYGALLRPAGEKPCIIVPPLRPELAPTCAVVQRVGDLFYVATYNGGGNLIVYEVPADTPRELVPVDPEWQDPSGIIRVTPTSGVSPLTVTGTVTLTQGATQQIRFYGQHGSDALVRWQGPTGNDLTADGTLTLTGAWAVWARLQGLNGAVVDLAAVPVTVLTPAPPPPPPSPFTLGLNAGFGDALPDARLSGFVRDGVKVVRNWIGLPERSDEIKAQLAKFPALTPLFLARAGFVDDVLRVPNNALIEPGNEPNLGDGPLGIPRMTPAQYAAWANAIRPTIEAKGLTAYWGCPSNLNKDGLAWLADVLRLCPWMTRVSVHRYNYGMTPNVEASPWGSRANEMAALKAVIGTRRFRVTEIGCKCGPQAYKNSTGFLGKDKKWMPYSEAQQLAYLRAEVAKWKAIPTCDGCDIYQENSGTESDYGLNSLAGTRRQAWAIFG